METVANEVHLTHCSQARILLYIQNFYLLWDCYDTKNNVDEMKNKFFA